MNPTFDTSCLSVPIWITPAYVPRSELLQELAQKLQAPYGGKKCVVHAVTVVGLGGTGKSQLVLGYIEKHLLDKLEYDTVLWLDGSSKTSLLFSFVRCCHALRLPSQGYTVSGPLRDQSPVTAVLGWLAARSNEQPWLMILDGIDEMKSDGWSVMDVLRQRLGNDCTGSVVMTSRDWKASRQLGPETEVVKVNSMSEEQAKDLLWKRIAGDTASACTDRPERGLSMVAQYLELFPLAVDLAGSKVNEDMETLEPDTDVRRANLARPAESALTAHMRDLQSNFGSLMRTGKLVSTGQYEQSMWTVWEPTLRALETIEAENEDIHPLRLLTLLAESPCPDVKECSLQIGFFAKHKR